jgi:hypothetical protein
LREQVERLQRELATAKRSSTIDNRDYEMVEVEAIGPHLVMRVRYPSCRDCAFEGDKVMVLLDCPVIEALKWRQIDPHFRLEASDATAAPPPAARFPATPNGWADAITYARGKTK